MFFFLLYYTSCLYVSQFLHHKSNMIRFETTLCFVKYHLIFYLHLAIHNIVLPKHVLHEWWIVRRLQTVLLKLPTKWPGFILGYWGQCCFVLWVIVIDWMFWKCMCLQAWWSCISPLICVYTFWVISIIS